MENCAYLRKNPGYAPDNYCVLCTVKAQKGNKNLQQRTFVWFHNHSPLLTMCRVSVAREQQHNQDLKRIF